MRHISASILACPPFDIKSGILKLADAGVSSIHYDVMDGHYVDQITGDFGLCQAITKTTSLPVYVHLMVDNPKKQIERFAKSGAYAISFHPVCESLNDLVQTIKSYGMKAGIAITNEKEMDMLFHVNNIDYVTVMTVEPGQCGQPMDLEKIKNITYIKHVMPKMQIFVDGGVNEKTLHMVRNADAFIAGSHLFGGPIQERVQKLILC